jgi:putative ABC transport system permease protein
MLRNYLKSAVRHLIKHKSYALISLVSLVIGITSFILLMLYAKNELSYDAFQKNSGRIYQIGQYLPAWNVGGTSNFAATSGILAPTLAKEFPEVETAVRIVATDAPVIYQRHSVLGSGLYADKDFFNVFTYPLTAGDPATALREPFTAVLSKSLAGKLFGRDDPLGKIVVHQNGREFKVTGIIEDAPRNSHLRFDYLLSFATMYSLRNDIDTEWSILNYYTYVLLKEGVSAAAFESKLKTIIEKYHQPRDKDRRYFLLPLRRIHIDPNVDQRLSPTLDVKSIHLLMLIAVVVLIIACVNYVNLATARATVRAKEVGVRKTFGAARSHLIAQFIGESCLLTLIGILVSLVIVRLGLPAFEKLAAVDLPGGFRMDGTTVLGLVGLLIVVGFLSGAYPSLVLASLNPANVFKTTRESRSVARRLNFRNLLVVFQFFATLVLLVGAIVIQKQMRFIRTADIGYERSDVVALRLWDLDSRKSFPIIKSELLQNPNILAATVANTAPVRFTEANSVKVENEAGELVSLAQVTTYFIDEDYFKVFGMKIVEGRGYSQALLGDIAREVVVNETLARMAGLKNPIGKTFVKWGTNMRIIGVVKDIHFTSLKSKIGPLMFTYAPERAGMCFLKISNRNVDGTLKSVAATFRKHSPDFVYDYTSMEDIYGALYKNETKLAGILAVFSAMAILVAAIGLFGLISFIVEKKKKEIGIRKVLGASALAILGSLIRDIFVLIAAAGLLSFPLAYLFSKKWLQGFAYRTELNVWVFALAALIVVLIALASVARLTVRAARTNPAASLKNEG